MQHQARKRFGQHFLVDISVLDAIVKAIAPQSNTNIVEIGPGLGALTFHLLPHLSNLTVVELDRDLAARLRSGPHAAKLNVIEADALRVDFSALGVSAPFNIVGNLPYNISSPILFHLLPFAKLVAQQVFMLQKEVIDRMLAAPSTADYGRLSVMLQAHYAMHRVCNVPPEAFDPPPRVDSAVIKMIPLAQPIISAAQMPKFEKIVAQAFNQRRKMVRSVLKEFAAGFAAAGIAPESRAENISVAQYAKLTEFALEAGL